MNPFELIIIIFSGILIVILLKEFLITLLINKENINEYIDLVNIINIYKEGKWLNAFFNVSYNISGNMLNITPSYLIMGNAHIPNPDIPLINCSSNQIIISEGGIKC